MGITWHSIRRISSWYVAVLVAPLWVLSGQVHADFTNTTDCLAVGKAQALTADQRLDKEGLLAWQGKSIHRLEINIENIFDETNPKEDNWLYRLANRLQVNTRETTVRAQLLFKEGDRLDVEIIDESLRRLYRKEYILDVKLRPVADCVDGVVLALNVRDAWTIEPRISAGHEGGESSGEFGLRDGNFLGTGAELELIYKADAERSQIDYKYRSQNFLNSRWLAEFYHADLSDGENNRVILERPFYANNTQWAYGISVERLMQVDKIRESNALINAYQHQIDTDSAFIGHSLSTNNERTYRASIGVTGVEHNFYDVDETEYLPLAERQQYTWIELQRQSNRFKTYSNLNFIKRAEDVAMGQRFSVKLGQGIWGQEQGMSRVLASYTKATSIGDAHLLELRGYSDLTYLTDSRYFTHSQWGARASYHHYINRKNRWQVKASWDRGVHLPEYRELTLGEEAGMRGYPLSYQRGENRYLINIERRFYSDIHWFNLIRVGAVAFFDAGRAWDDGMSEDTDHLASAGVGLRLHTSKSGNPAVIHINLSKPLIVEDDIDTYLMSVAVTSAF